MSRPCNGWTKESILKHIKDNFVCKSLGPSTVEGNMTCKYRGNGGAKCAVGMFIPDELYLSQFEGLGVYDIIAMEPRLRAVLPLTEDAMGHLQNIHDNSSDDTCLQKMLDWVEYIVADSP